MFPVTHLRASPRRERGRDAFQIVPTSRAPTDPTERGRKMIATLDGSTISAAGYRAGTAVLWDRIDRILTPEQLWRVYLTTPDARAAIDSIVRRVATWDHGVEVTVPASDPRHAKASAAANEAATWLEAPAKEMTWQDWATAYVTDLLVYDLAAAEIVRSGKRLVEIPPFNGGWTYPAVDGHNIVTAWHLFPYGVATDTPPSWKPEEVLICQLHPNTRHPLGTPMLETLVNEVSTLLVTSEHLLLAWDANEIPPGLLVLGGLAKEAISLAKADAQHMRGKDHKLRIVAGPTGADAKWLDLRHTPKDLAYQDVINEVRRTVWRCFGVLPVEMGQTDGVPRASAEVQMDVSRSHLLEPILELLQARINARLMPLLIPDPEIRALCRFYFDREARLTPEEQEAMARTHKVYLDGGVMTVNETRQALGMEPYTDAGDTPTVLDGNVHVALAGISKGQEMAPVVAEPAAEKPSDEPAPVEGPGTSESETGSEPTEDSARSALRRAVSAHPPGCACADHAPHARTLAEIAAAAEPMPSDWQPAGRFAGYRTLDLPKLGRSVASYDRTAGALYLDAAAAHLASVGALLRQYGSAGAAVHMPAATQTVLDRLAIDWSAATEPLYLQAARIGREAARTYTGNPDALADWEQRGLAYHARAMSYLTDADGLLAAVGQRSAEAWTVERSSEAVPDTRADVVDAEELAAREAILGGVEAAWASQAYRVPNWGGKLVELANECFGSGMREVGPVDPTTGAPDEWMAEWVKVGDTLTCPECDDEGAQGIRPLSSFSRVPGGTTSCGARCRCVLVVWLRSEVQSGTAISLSGGVDGRPPL